MATATLRPYVSQKFGLIVEKDLNVGRNSTLWQSSKSTSMFFGLKSFFFLLVSYEAVVDICGANIDELSPQEAVEKLQQLQSFLQSRGYSR